MFSIYRYLINFQIVPAFPPIYICVFLSQMNPMCTGQCVKMLYLKCNNKSGEARTFLHIFSFGCVSLQNLQRKVALNPHNYESKVICPQQWPLEYFSRGHHRRCRVRDILGSIKYICYHGMNHKRMKMYIHRYIICTFFSWTNSENSP